MSNAVSRKVVPSIRYNGKKVSTALADFIENVSFEDIADGESDTLSIQLHNIDLRWMSTWYPQLKDKLSCTFTFKDWNWPGNNVKLSCGNFTLADVTFSGNPRIGKLEAVALPAAASLQCRQRTKTWKKVKLKKIGKEIAKRYGLKYSYSGSAITIKVIEQTNETDLTFLQKVCETYGRGLKIYKGKIVIFDKASLEKKKAVASITPASFIDGAWTYNTTLTGTYTGARISYRKKKGKKKKKEKIISIYVGYTKEDKSGARMLKLSDQAESKADAKLKAAAKVNAANESAVTLEGPIWPNPKIVAGATVTVKSFGKANGKYFVDKVTTDINEGATMTVEMHKCQKRLKGK